MFASSGLSYYRHADWLGSSRFASTTNRGMYYDGAYAPFGESYAEIGTTDRSFTGQDQDTLAGQYDFLFRRYDPTAGRWTSPDPAGLAAVNPGDPQSWNRYAYVRNNPASLVDPLGLADCIPFLVFYDDPRKVKTVNVCFPDGNGYGGGGAGSGTPGQNARPAPEMRPGETSVEAANNGKPPCISTSSLNWSQKAQLTAAQFYANVTGWTFGFGAGLDAGAGIGPKGSKWNFGLGGSGSTLIVADASGNAGFLNSVSGGFSAVKMGGTGRWGAGAAAGPSFLVSPNPISTIAGPSGSISAGGGAVLGAGFSLTTSGAATFTFGVGAGAEAGISPQGGTSQFIPFCHN